ncbi:MAG: transketolase, partial [Herminiimonas sp.]|nr:transketolase [Herminiimonas sp.]
AHLAARFNRDGHMLIDHHTYGLVSDGDLMEGVAAGAASLAGHLQLGKLIYLYDNNQVTLSAGTDITFTEDCAARFDAYGWHTQAVEDGNDLDALEQALHAARAETGRPSLILVRTHLGFGSPKQDSFEAHGSPLGAENVRLTKRKLGWPEEPAFLVPETVQAHFQALGQRGRHAHTDWQQRHQAYRHQFPELAAEFDQLTQEGGCGLPDGWDAGIPQFAADAKGIATRVASGKVMNGIAARLTALIGGSADLDPSTYTALKGTGDFEPAAIVAPDRQGADGGGWTYAGRNLHFGVREHAMAAICNGIAAHGGAIPFCATFLIFSDYMRPSIRLAALMKLRVVFVFTHDSIALGEDGSTHQPVEQLASLRAIPDLIVIRPADANETAYAWRAALQSRDRPVALVLSRQALPTLDRTAFNPAAGLLRGAYVLAEAASGKAQLTLIASGSEVTLALAAQQALLRQDVHARVVSMPCWELFDEQPQDYRDQVLPPSRLRLAIEAGVTQGWHRYVGDRGDVLGVDCFGASAPGDVMMEKYGFTVDNVCLRAQALLRAQPA